MSALQTTESKQVKENSSESSTETVEAEFVANQRTEQVSDKLLLQEGITQIHHVFAFGIIPFRINLNSRKQPFIEYLLIHARRSDKWSFPKGKIDPGEPKNGILTAKREFSEETGIDYYNNPKLAHYCDTQHPWVIKYNYSREAVNNGGLRDINYDLIDDPTNRAIVYKYIGFFLTQFKNGNKKKKKNKNNNNNNNTNNINSSNDSKSEEKIEKELIDDLTSKLEISVKIFEGSEIKNIKWMTFENGFNSFRQFDVSKDILAKINNLLVRQLGRQQSCYGGHTIINGDSSDIIVKIQCPINQRYFDCCKSEKWLIHRLNTKLDNKKRIELQSKRDCVDCGQIKMQHDNHDACDGIEKYTYNQQNDRYSLGHMRKHKHYYKHKHKQQNREEYQDKQRYHYKDDRHKNDNHYTTRSRYNNDYNYINSGDHQHSENFNSNQSRNSKNCKYNYNYNHDYDWHDYNYNLYSIGNCNKGFDCVNNFDHDERNGYSCNYNYDYNYNGVYKEHNGHRKTHDYNYRDRNDIYHNWNDKYDETQENRYRGRDGRNRNRNGNRNIYPQKGSKGKAKKSYWQRKG